MKNFNEKLVELRKLRRELISKENNINEQKEIKKVELDIIRADEDIYKFNKKIIECSTFYVRDIVEVITNIIRIYEGKQFVLDEFHYHPNPERLIITEKALVLLSKEKQKFLRTGTHHIGKVHAIQKHGDGIVLNWDINKGNKNYIKFYDFNHVNELMSNIKLNRFPYLKDFIDFVILYKINNKIEDDLSFKKLLDLKQQFIFANVEKIEKYHEIVKFNEENKMKKEIDKNAENRNKQLKKALRKEIGGNYEI